MQECEDHGSGSRDKASRRPGRGRGGGGHGPAHTFAEQRRHRGAGCPGAQRVRSGAVHMVT